MGHYARMCRTKNPGKGGTHPRQSRREHYEVERTHHSCGHSHCSAAESDYELHEDTVQIVYNTTNAQTNIKFDEISNSQALGDLNLSNRAGKVITQRFKLDRLKVTPVKIHLKPGVEPHQKPCRRVPIAIRSQFKDELDSMEGQGTITKLDKNTVTPWLNSFVNVGKKDQKSLRVCLDPTGLNPYIIRPVCNSYTLDEISYMLKDAKVMSVVDANKGFFQIPLDDESKLLTAMGTPYGVYIFNVLAMGLSLASDVFEITIRDITKNLKGVINIADDILIYGSTVEDHDRNLLALLDRALEVNLTLNPKKFKFKCTSVQVYHFLATFLLTMA